MPSKNILNLAIKTAKKSEHEFRCACVIYHGSSIINAKQNTTQHIGYRGKYFKYLPTKHAEMFAMHNVSREVLQRADMLVVRIDRLNRLCSAMPCSACISAILASGIKRVYYSNYKGEIVRMNLDTIDLNNYHKERK